MGIDNFHKWLRASYPECYSKPYNIDHVYVDINFALHNAIYGTTCQKTLLIRLQHGLDNLLHNTHPNKSITYATDGPAPFAKIILQRKRRLNTSRTSDLTDTKINPLYFTPGTVFMSNLSKNLDKYLEKVKALYQIKINILMSGPDEAELKIIRSLIKQSTNKTDTHVIVSNDADIVVMACALHNIRNVYIMIKNPTIQFISIDKLVDGIQSKNNIKGISLFPGIDISMVSLFMGNDYLPKLNFIDFNKMYSSYFDTCKIFKQGLIADNYSFNKKFLLELFRTICVNLDQKWINRFKFTNFNKDLYKNYLEGLLWCIKSYATGLCEKYDYMYNYKESPHPLGILYYLELVNNEITYPVPASMPIPEKVYGILVIPKKAKYLIDSKYYNIIDTKLNFLFEEEECKDCHEYHSESSKLHKKLKLLDTLEEDTDEVKGELRIISSKMIKHKKVHKKLTATDINKVLNYF
jgi:5'-3' exonuclease